MAHITVSIAQIQRVLRTVSLQVEATHIDVMGHMNVGHYGMLFARAAREATSQIGVTEDFIQRTQQGAFMLKHFHQVLKMFVSERDSPVILAEPKNKGINLKKCFRNF